MFLLETFSPNLSTRELSDTFRMQTIEPDDGSVILQKSVSPQIRDNKMEKRYDGFQRTKRMCCCTFIFLWSPEYLLTFRWLSPVVVIFPC